MNLKILPISLMVLGLAACTTYPSSSYNNGAYHGSGSVNCYDCGVVEHIAGYSGERRTSGAGAVAGAVIGGAIGSQVGSGDGKTAATVAGAVAGGFAGNAIEKNRNQNWYDLTIVMNDGRRLIVTQNDLDGIREGSRVVIRDGRAHLD